MDVSQAKASINFSGAIVLYLLQYWMYRRSIKNFALSYIATGLLSMSVVGVFHLNFLLNYLLSPISNIMFICATFKLARIREKFQQTELKHLPLIIQISIFLSGILSVFLTYNSKKSEYINPGPIVDAIVSSFVLMSICIAIIYSFYKYKNVLMSGVTAIVYCYLIFLQFFYAIAGSEIRNKMIAQYANFELVNTSLQVLIFVVLAVAWGLSSTAQLTIVGKPESVVVTAMIIDLRGSTQWARSVLRGDYQFASQFIDELRQWLWTIAMAEIDVPPILIKFLGDGFMLIWESSNATIGDRSHQLVELGCKINEGYSNWIQSSRFWQDVPRFIAIGIDYGAALMLSFENGNVDYLGEPVNIAAKLQDLARPSGGVVIRENFWRRLSDDDLLKQKFTEEGELTLGQETIRVRATHEVKLPELAIVNQSR